MVTFINKMVFVCRLYNSWKEVKLDDCCQVKNQDDCCQDDCYQINNLIDYCQVINPNNKIKEKKLNLNKYDIKFNYYGSYRRNTEFNKKYRYKDKRYDTYKRYRYINLIIRRIQTNPHKILQKIINRNKKHKKQVQFV